MHNLCCYKADLHTQLLPKTVACNLQSGAKIIETTAQMPPSPPIQCCVND